MKTIPRHTATALFLIFGLTVTLALVSCGGIKTQKDANEETAEKAIVPLSLQDSLLVPPKELPTGGMCRIWMPGLPPKDQDGPGNCFHLKNKIPPGALMLYRPIEDPTHVRVVEYHKEKPMVVVAVRYYVAATGKFAWSEDAR